MIQLLVRRCGDGGGAEGVEDEVGGEQAGEKATAAAVRDRERIPQLAGRVQDGGLGGEGAVDEALHLGEQAIRRCLRRKGAGDLIDVAGLIPGE